MLGDGRGGAPVGEGCDHSGGRPGWCARCAARLADLALVHGPAYSAGLTRSSFASDVLLVGATRSSRQRSSSRALQATLGVSYFLTRADFRSASELMLTGDAFSAERAHRLGIASLW